MEQHPFFSIIIPAFNVEKFISPLLEAIISQSFSDWEMIIVDDASTDSTLQILRRYENNPKIRIISLPQNLGNPFKVREKALEYSQAPYILPIDADDLIEPSLLQTLYQDIRQYDLDLAVPVMWRFSESISPYKILPTEVVSEDEVYWGKNLVKFTLSGWQIPMAGYAVRKEFFSKACKEIEKIGLKTMFCDELLSRFILLYARNVKFVSARYLYRLNESSITSQPFRQIIDYYHTQAALLKFCIDNFGVDSHEYIAVSLMRVYEVFAFYDHIDSAKFSRVQTDEMKRLVELTRKEKLTPKVKRSLSLQYRVIFMAPIWLGRKINFLRKSLRNLMPR